jgi:hypothetical protein
MPKFTLTCQHTSLWTNEQVCKNTHEFEVETLSEVLENFEMFLRGAGYVFDGVIDVVPHEEDYFGDGHEGMSTLDDYPELKKEVEAEHSHHYWETERNKPASDPNWPFAAPHPQAPDEWTQVIRGEGT